MSIRKKKLKDGSFSWGYYFDAPGSTRADRHKVTGHGFASKKEAMDAEAKRRIEENERHRQAGGVQADAPRTLGALIGEYMREHVKQSLELTTGQHYEQVQKYLSMELLGMPLGDLTRLILTREWNRIGEEGGRKGGPLSGGTVGNVKRFVSSVLSWATEMDIIASNPAERSKVPGGRRKSEARIASMGQLDLLIGSAPEDLAEYMEIAAALGARRGEVLALDWPNINGNQVLLKRSRAPLKGGAIFKDNKTHRQRFVTLPPSAVAVLDRIRARQARLKQQMGPHYRDQGLVFCSPEGDPLDPAYTSTRVGRLCKKLNLTGVKLHTLRHTHASELLADGMEIPAVSKRLGHASPRVTMEIYAHVVAGRDQELAASWDRRRGTTGAPRGTTGHHQGGKSRGKGKERRDGSTGNQALTVN